MRVAVVDVGAHPLADARNGLLLLLDPQIIESVGSEVRREGCQSLPYLIAEVRRAKRIVFSSRDRLGWAAGLEARAVQHELDHLDGVLIVDRVAHAHGLHRRADTRPSPVDPAGVADEDVEWQNSASARSG